MTSANNLGELGSRYLPCQGSEENPASADAFCEALWHPKQISELSCAQSPDPEQRQGDEHVWFYAAETVVICYATTENKHSSLCSSPHFWAISFLNIQLIIQIISSSHEQQRLKLLTKTLLDSLGKN